MAGVADLLRDAVELHPVRVIVFAPLGVAVGVGLAVRAAEQVWVQVAGRGGAADLDQFDQGLAAQTQIVGFGFDRGHRRRFEITACGGGGAAGGVAGFDGPAVEKQGSRLCPRWITWHGTSAK